MRKLLLATVLTGFMGASVAMAIPASGVIEAHQTPGLSYGNGGEFTAIVNNNPSTAFQTWCLEIHNDFSPGTDYSYTLGQTTHNNPPGASPLKLGAAYLVSQWNLGVYGSGLVVGEFQAALWYFQGQDFTGQTGANDFSGWGNGAPGSDIYTTDAIAALTLLGKNASDASNGAYGVQVIQLVGGQDWTNVPDGGTTVVLLGIGLVGLVLVSRRFAIAR